jgi:hypothetical protein
MQEQGFRWFYAGAMEPERDSGLLAQLERNPGLETVRAEGGARLYRVR